MKCQCHEIHNIRNDILHKMFHSFTFSGENDEAQGKVPGAPPFYPVDKLQWYGHHPLLVWVACFGGTIKQARLSSHILPIWSNSK